MMHLATKNLPQCSLETTGRRSWRHGDKLCLVGILAQMGTKSNIYFSKLNHLGVML